MTIVLRHLSELQFLRHIQNVTTLLLLFLLIYLFVVVASLHYVHIYLDYSFWIHIHNSIKLHLFIPSVTLSF